MSNFTRSKIIQEVVNAVAGRFGNLLATLIQPKTPRYEWLDSLVGTINIKGKKKVTLSTDIDDIYYR